MNNLEFTFDAAPWELLLDRAENSVSALALLTCLEGVSEDEYEEAMACLETKMILPDLSDLPKPPPAARLLCGCAGRSSWWRRDCCCRKNWRIWRRLLKSMLY